VRVEHPFTRRDALSIAVLWAHALAGFGWIVGVLALAVALGPWRLLSERAATAVRRVYVPWGAVAHWALAVAVIASGIYNLVYVTPFALVWRPGELARLSAIPYGALYQGILLVKLALFALLVVLATLLLRRTLRASPSLGLALPAYLIAVPLTVAAAAALRYVHVLSHVADVLQQG
jgi:hypothetical protein